MKSKNRSWTIGDHTATTFDQALQLQRQQRDDLIQQLQKYPRYADPQMKRLLKKRNIGTLESLLRLAQADTVL